jgi:hypothetical protein
MHQCAGVSLPSSTYSYSVTSIVIWWECGYRLRLQKKRTSTSTFDLGQDSPARRLTRTFSPCVSSSCAIVWATPLAVLDSSARAFASATAASFANAPLSRARARSLRTFSVRVVIAGFIHKCSKNPIGARFPVRRPGVASAGKPGLFRVRRESAVPEWRACRNFPRKIRTGGDCSGFLFRR